MRNAFDFLYFIHNIGFLRECVTIDVDGNIIMDKAKAIG